MKIVLEDAKEVANGMWLTFAAPHQLTRLGQTESRSGRRSVLLAAHPIFDADQKHLLVDADSVRVLNVGTTPSLVVVDTMAPAELVHQEIGARNAASHQLGPGDRDFLGLAERELDTAARQAAVDLVNGVRSKWPGDLKRGERNNFSETPDNFWYVIVQPRVQSLSITVRGAHERFPESTLDLKQDRPGYTRFKVTRPEEVAEALRLIEWSKRKKPSRGVF